MTDDLPARQLFNGAPRVVARWIDQPSLTSGLRVLHVGCGPGYYSAIMAHVVGPTGRVVAVEIDQALVREARRNLAPIAWVDVQQGDGTSPSGESFDAILIHAGVAATHTLQSRRAGCTAITSVCRPPDGPRSPARRTQIMDPLEFGPSDSQYGHAPSLRLDRNP